MGGCTALGSYPQGWFYFMAEGQGDVIWKGETYGKRVCVSYPGPFEGTFTGDYYCGPNEMIREFNELLIAPDIGSYTLNSELSRSRTAHERLPISLRTPFIQSVFNCRRRRQIHSRLRD